MSDSVPAGESRTDLPPLEFLPTLEEWLAGREKYPCPKPRSWFVMTGNVVVTKGTRAVDGRSEDYVREIWIDRRAEVRPTVLVPESAYTWCLEIRPMKLPEVGVGVCVLGRVELHVAMDGVPDGRQYIRAGTFKLDGGSIVIVDLAAWHRVLLDAMGHEKEEHSIAPKAAKKAG